MPDFPARNRLPPEIEVVHSLPRPVYLAVLEAFAQSSVLWRDYVLKGGLALQGAYASPRPSHDFDFSALKPFSPEISEEKNELLRAFGTILEDGLAKVARLHGLGRVAVREEFVSDEIPALFGHVVYVRADGQAAERAVEIQVTLSEVICEVSRVEVEGIPVHVPVLEDILADKLKAIVQQVRRRKYRASDAYDLWYFTTHSAYEPDVDKVRRYLQVKVASREQLPPLTRAHYRDPRVKAYSAVGYDDLLAGLPPDAPAAALDEAFDAILRFVDRLDLPG